MRGSKLFSAFVCALLLCGCWGGGNQTVYDWRAPAPHTDFMLRGGSFRNFTAAGLALRYQKADGTVSIDPYRRWSQTPELMLRCYLLTAFSGAKPDAKTVGIDCTIFEFRTDVEKEVCSLGLEYTLKQGKEKKTHVFRAEKPFRRKDPASIGEAFSDAADDLVKEIAAAAK